MLGGEVNLVAPGHQDDLPGEVIAGKVLDAGGVDPLVGLLSAGQQGRGIAQEHHVIRRGPVALVIQGGPSCIDTVRQHAI